MNKYHAVKTDGYDSRKEAVRARELKLLERAGKIKKLREQVKYELLPSFYANDAGEIIDSASVPHCQSWYEKNGWYCIERRVNYVADFVYEDEAGQTVVEDVKGYKTADYVIKRKLMLAIHGIRIKEV